jgi:hypothetical protein
MLYTQQLPIIRVCQFMLDDGTDSTCLTKKISPIMHGRKGEHEAILAACCERRAHSNACWMIGCFTWPKKNTNEIKTTTVKEGALKDL